MGTRISTSLSHLLKRQRPVVGIRFIALLLVLALYLQCLVMTPINAAPKTNATKKPTTARPGKPFTSVTQGSEIVVFGPRRIDRTAPLSRFSDQFTLPGDAVAPFNIQIANGDLNGQGRVLSADVQ